jgi:hypothetical protein
MRSNIAIPVMIVLHSAAGVAIDVNTELITHLRGPEPASSGVGGVFTPNVKCQINMSDGKFVTVVESCKEVRSIMDNRKSKR